MGFYELLDLLTWLSPTILLIGSVVGFFRFGTLDGVHRLLTGYLLFELCVDIASRLIGHYGKSNLIVIPFMNLVELLFFLRIYFIWLGRKSLPFVGSVLLIFLVFFVCELYELRMLPVEERQTYTGILGPFWVVGFSLALFTLSLREPEKMNWQLFSLNAVVLFFFSVKLVFAIPLNFLVNEDSGLSLSFWFAWLFITLFFYIYLIRSLWKNGRIRT
jgi:hypothetical protein